MGELQRVEIIFLCSLSTDQEVVLSEEHTEYAWVFKEQLPHYELDNFMKTLLNKITEDLDYLIKKYFS